MLIPVARDAWVLGNNSNKLKLFSAAIFHIAGYFAFCFFFFTNIAFFHNYRYVLKKALLSKMERQLMQYIGRCFLTYISS